MKIKRPKLSDLPNDKYVRMNTQVKELVVETGADKLNVDKFFEPVYLVQYDALIKAFKPITESAFTKMILAADGVRDDAIWGFNDVIKGYSRYHIAEYRVAADKIKVVLDGLGDIAKKSYDAQTALFDELISVLEGRLAAEVELLGVGDWVGQFKKSNKDFVDLMAERNKEKFDKSELTVGEIRKQLDDSLRKLFYMTEAFAGADNSGVYKEFIRKLNIILARYGARGGNGGDSTITPEEVDYPDAKEWEEDLPFMGVENGDIYYILVDGKKVFYKLVDKSSFFDSPDSAKGAGGWEKL